MFKPELLFKTAAAFTSEALRNIKS